MDGEKAMEDALPKSIAIAGAWGYIGRKFVDAARALGVDRFAFDPSDVPEHADRFGLHRVTDEREFYQLPADLFHLAVHPEHREIATRALLKRSASERIVVLNEKPMAAPERPEQCEAIVREVDGSEIVMLYDFPELYDPLTARILEILAGFSEVRIDEIQLCRSKDREDRTNPRNQKRMVTIQYQETVHCLAFLLHLFGRLRGGLEPVLDRGVSVRAWAEPYDPPNPKAYPHVVDGRCEYTLQLGDCRIRGLTDFKSGASWAKTRIIRGVGDGRPFTIAADYLEGEKWLTVDGNPEPWDRKSNSYEHVIRTLWRWQNLPRQELMQGVYPNPAFARATYQLSSVIWRSCYQGGEIQLPSLARLLAFDAGYGKAAVGFSRYQEGALP